MEIKTEDDYKKALKHRAALLESYSFIGDVNADSVDRQISEVDASISYYEASKTK